jgi:hypothetical protein
MMRSRLALIALACVLVAAVGWAAHEEMSSTTTDLAAFVPQGALLTIESPDFGSLLKKWQSSAEEVSWLTSDDHAVFSRSRLYANLQSAQTDFASAAGVPVDGSLVTELAGKQSFLAWYDIGTLKMVYITRMTSAMAEQSHLLQQHKQFETRQAGGVTFYVRSSPQDSDGDSGQADTTSDTTPSADSSTETTSDDASSQAAGQTRTIAFAQSGDWLILTTDENLMAQTLELMTSKRGASRDALAQQSWYSEARADAPTSPGALRMILNMSAIVGKPQFRTYWVQQNITEMKQYKTAVDDLYEDGVTMRDERVLVPASDVTLVSNAELSQLAGLVPDHTVVYRAVAHPSRDEALSALRQKVLDRDVSDMEDTTAAPTADLTTPQAGNTVDLETTIDGPQPVVSAASQTMPLLESLLQSASIQSMMTVDRNGANASSSTIWTQFSGAVVLSSDRDWDLRGVEDAVQQTLQQRLSVGDLGIAWQQRSANGLAYVMVSDAHPIQIAVVGHLCVIADDADLLVDILRKQQQAKQENVEPAMMLSGFNHDAAKPGYRQWTTIVDKLNPKTAASKPAEANDAESPAFFGRDMESLSTAFASLQSESFKSRQDGKLVRQTVTYLWAR